MSDSNRKLAAIVFTDIVGFTELTAKNQSKASALLKQQRKIFQPIIHDYKGNWVKEVGDGLILTFDTITDAVNCCIKLQKTSKNIDDLNLRIGIHLGEILIEENDIIGDDVNVAARIEPFSAPGGIAISNKVHDAIIREEQFETKYLGKPKLKGVGQEVKVYCITSHDLPETKLTEVSAKLESKGFQWNFYNLTGVVLTVIGFLFLINVAFFQIGMSSYKGLPSMAIIPFENKGDKTDEFYSYGLSTDLISSVSSTGLLRVASIKDIEILDYQNIKNTDLSKNLSVRYLLQGTLWKLDNVFQLALELFDSKNSAIIWTEKWKTDWKKLVDIQNEIPKKLLGQLNLKQDSKSRPNLVLNPEAYEFYLRAKHSYDKIEKTDDIFIIRSLLYKAIELDDDFLKAKNLLAKTFEYTSDYKKAFQLFTKNLKQSDQVGDYLSKAEALHGIGSYHGRNGKNNEKYELYKQAYDLQIKFNDINGQMKSQIAIGKILFSQGKYKDAIEMYQLALKNARLENDLRTQYSIHSGIARFYNQQGNQNRDSVFFHTEQALFTTRELGVEKLKAEALFKMSWMNADPLLETENYNKSIEYANKALKISKENSFIDWEIRCLDRLGYTYKLKGDTSQYVNYYYKQIDIANKNKKSNTLYDLYYSISGDIKWSEKPIFNYDLIHKMITDSYGVALEDNNKIFQALMLKAFGFLYQEKSGFKSSKGLQSDSDLTTAFEYYNESLGLLESLGNKKEIHEVLINILEISIALDQKNDFDEYYAKDEIIVSDIDNPLYIADLFSTKKRMFEVSGDFYEAIKISLKVLEIHNSNNHVNYSKENLVSLQSYYFQIGDFDNAQRINKELLRRKTEIDSLIYLGTLDDILFFKKEYENALNIVEQHSIIADKQTWWGEEGIRRFKKGGLRISLASKKHLGINIDSSVINSYRSYIENKTKIGKPTFYNMIFWYTVYLILGDEEYIEYAYNLLIEKTNTMDLVYGEKYLEYPIQKKILMEYKKYN